MQLYFKLQEMARVKIIAKILYYISRVSALGYCCIVLYAIGCLVTHTNTHPYGEGKYLHILYPFTNVPFLNIDNNLTYILLDFLLPLSLYTSFFWLAAGIFKVFYLPKLFSTENITRLRRFYLFNLFVPGIAALFSRLFTEVESVVWGLIVVHLFLGIFTYFLAAIFKQGLRLQNEQDLFI